MFLKSLAITTGSGKIIRDIRFHAGLNLIIDETPAGSGQVTGNSVGKTTVLKLIDYCLGGSAREIYSDPENRQNEYRLVKDFLVAERVEVCLCLTDDLSHEDAREVRIERNFLSRKNKVQRIDGHDKTDEEFEEGLTNLLFSGHYGQKPTFRQIISHNIRYKDDSVNYTLKTLDRFTKLDEYETLYLFLLGCDFAQGETKQAVRVKIDLEEKFRRRLETKQTKSGYEGMLVQLEADIRKIDARRADMHLNPNLAADIRELNSVRIQINFAASELGRLELRRDLISEAQREMSAEKSTIDLQQLRLLYDQAKSLVGGIQKEFEELHEFHNQMVVARSRFIVEELPQLNARIAEVRQDLRELIAEESRLAAAVTKTDSFAAVEALIGEQNLLFQKKGEYENIIRQLTEVESKLAQLNAELAAIDDELFSTDFSQRLRAQLAKFNLHFSAVSDELYGERYALKADVKIVNGRRVYVFSAFNTNNYSSGKKQGEISCFDIAYALFADDEEIPCMHFLLNDKKELMHDNQLVKIAQLVKTKRIQFVASILQDKLPEELRQKENITLRLSPDDKLFRIEPPTTKT